MKNMRKLTALLLAVVMVLSLSIAVWRKLRQSDLEWHNPVHSIRVFSEERSHYVYGKCNSYI